MLPLAEAHHNAQGINLPTHVYDLILTYMNTLSTSSPIRHFKNLPHPMDVYVLPRTAMSTDHLEQKGRGYSTFSMHPGNSCISYKSKNDNIGTGFIASMWAQVLMGKLYQFIIISPHKYLSVDDEQKSPYPSRPGFLCTQIYHQQSEIYEQVIVEPNQIISHLGYFDRPSGLFGIEAKTRILVKSLHRNR